MSAGFGYAGSPEGNLVALGGHERACLFLNEEARVLMAHPKLAKRAKECARQLRKCAREGRVVSLRINSVPLRDSVALLRVHHEDNWGAVWAS